MSSHTGKISLGAMLTLVLSCQGSSQTYGWEKKVAVAGLGNPLTYNPVNSNTLYGASFVGNDGSVVVSYDRGVTWQLYSVVAGGRNIKSIIVSPLDTLTILVGQEGSAIDRVMKTTDGGMNWEETLTGDFGYFSTPLEFNVAHPDTVFTMMADSILRSVDFGSTWEVMNSHTAFPHWCDAALRADSVNVMYIGAFGSGIWKTTDGGVTLRHVYQTNGEIPMIAVDPSNPAIAFATKYSGGGGMLKTTDFGETWNPLSVFGGLNTWGVAINPNDSKFILMGTFEPLNLSMSTFLSRDGGESWTSIKCGLQRSSNYGVLILDSTTVLILQEDGMYKLRRVDFDRLPSASIKGEILDSLTGGGLRADLYLTATTCDSVITYIQDADSDGKFMFDGIPISVPPVISDYAMEVNPAIPYAHLKLSPIHLDTSNLTLALKTSTADVLLVGEDSVNFTAYYQTALESLGVTYNVRNTVSGGRVPIDRADQFKKRTAIYFSGNKHTPMSQHNLDSLVACLNLGCNLFLTGQDILEMNDSSELMKEYLRIGFGGNSSNSFVTGFSGGLFHRQEFSTSMTTGANNQTSRDILLPSDSRVKPEMGYGSGIRGTAVASIDSVGGGGKAIVMGFGFEAIGTFSSRLEVMRKIIGYFDGSIVVAVREDEVPQLPSNFRLEQNYPNPFNAETDLRLEIGDLSFVTVKIYDVLGREVITLLNDVKQAGKYSLSWDAEGMASGVYYARMISRSQTGIIRYFETKKLILMK